MDKRDRAATFRHRLTHAMSESHQSQSALARAAGVDRSTISQLLADGDTRLPNAQVVAECARVLGVSADWLLALSDRPERAGDLVAAAVNVEAAERTSADAQILRWHQEAAGYKIRHVPATLPDMLKTEAMLRWEYAAFLGKTPDQAVRAMMDRMTLINDGRSDYEIALPLHEITAFATGTGYYDGLPVEVRREQRDRLAHLAEDLFPALRIVLFDARTLYSAPVTIFGPVLAALYVGTVYLAFRSDDRVRAMTRHFDELVRACSVDARDVPTYLRALEIC